MIEMNPERIGEISGEGNIDKAQKLIDELELLSFDELSLHVEEINEIVAILKNESENVEARQARAKLSQLLEKIKRQ